MKFGVKIDGVNYSVPDSYTLGHWAKLNQWKLEDEQDHPFLAAAALGIRNVGSLIELKLENPDQFNFLLSLIISGINTKGKAKQEKVAGYKMLELEKLTLGTWMDLDILASDGKSMDKLFARLYEMPLEEAQELPLEDALPGLTLYLNWRTSVYRAYSNLFDYNDNKQQAKDTTEGTKMTPAHAWYESLMAVCGGKFENIQLAVGRPFREAFNFLAWKKTKMLEEKMELAKAQQKMNK